MVEEDPESWEGVCRSWNDQAGRGGHCLGLPVGRPCANPRNQYAHACIKCGSRSHPQQSCDIDDDMLPYPSDRNVQGPPKP